MLTSPVKFYSRFLPATPTYRIDYYFSQISYIHHDMHFLVPPPIKRIRRTFGDRYRQTNMKNLPCFMIVSLDGQWFAVDSRPLSLFFLPKSLSKTDFTIHIPGLTLLFEIFYNESQLHKYYDYK